MAHNVPHPQPRLTQEYPSANTKAFGIRFPTQELEGKYLICKSSFLFTVLSSLISLIFTLTVLQIQREEVLATQALHHRSQLRRLFWVEQAGALVDHRDFSLELPCFAGCFLSQISGSSLGC